MHGATCTLHFARERKMIKDNLDETIKEQKQHGKFVCYKKGRWQDFGIFNKI